VGTSTSGNIGIVVKGDFLDEDNETFFVDLTGVNPSGIANITSSHAIFTIGDDAADGPVNISLSNTPSTVGENAGTVSINVSLDLPSGKIVTVNYTVGGGSDTASSGIDYSAPSVGTLTFNPGEQVKSIDIQITDDNQASEGSEFLTVSLSSPVNGSISGSSSRQLFINDND
jgi:chitinase